MPVVWEGSRRETSPYPDQLLNAEHRTQRRSL